VGAPAPDAIATYAEWKYFSDSWTRIHDSEIVVGDQIYFIGLLTNVPSMLDQSIPMVRSGRIGALYQDDIPMRDGLVVKDEPIAHLIDTYSRAGFSGAPCFVEQAMIIQNPGEGPRIGSWVGLLGVVVGHFNGKAPVWHTADPDIDTGFLAASNEGVAVVVPVEILRQVLMHDDFVGERRVESQAIVAAKEAEIHSAAAVMDAVPIEGSSIERTADLAADLFKVPKDEADEVHRSHDQP